ncbi:acyl-CoA carboxylase subunit beta [Rhodococcus sp. C26F]
MAESNSCRASGQVERVRQAGLDGGRSDAVARQHRLGKLTARERIDRLVDPGSFTEFGALVAPTRDTAYDGEIDAPADGVVTGWGHLDGRPVAVASFDFTVAGGSNGTAGGLKMHRLAESARREGTPMILLLDGGGHRLQEGLDSWHFAAGFALFEEMVALSGFVPIVSAVLGPGFGGPANFAALSDFVVMVRGISSIGIAGPALVKAATGEVLSKEELGGADIQAERGVVDLAVDSEDEAFDAMRAFLGFLPSNSGQEPPHDSMPEVSDTAVSLDDVVPINPKLAYDVLDVVDALVDAESMFELRPRHAPNVVTSFARLGGRPVGIVANQPLHLGGALDSPACDKVAHFVSLCDAFGVALVYLVDVPGFLGGSAAEDSNLARRSGRMFFELGQATVPRLSVVMRKGYGAGYIAMCGGRSFSADLAVAWPTAEISATSVDGALDIAFRREIESSDDPEEYRQTLHDKFSEHITPLAAASGFGIDDVITPSATRNLLVSKLKRTPTRRQRTSPPKFRAISPI